MILILLGTQDNSFHRLLDKVQELIDKKVITEKVIVQAGRTKFESKDMEIYSLMPEEKLREIMEKADLVITHGGVGSIVMALKMGKKVIAVPRLSAFGEHINDHQIQIVDSFDKQDFLIGVTELDDLEEALNKAKTFKPKHFKSETDHMIKIIEDFIDNNVFLQKRDLGDVPRIPIFLFKKYKILNIQYMLYFVDTYTVLI